MNNQKTRLLLSFLMLVLLVTVILSWLGVLPADSTGDKILGLIPDESIQAAEPDPAESEISVETNPSIDQSQLLQLNLSESPAISGAENGLQRWPDESTLPDLIKVDLSAYQNWEKSEQALTGITVFLDPGHGGHDSGATYPAHAQKPEINESEVNLAVSLKTKAQLEALGATVYLIREQDEWLSIFYRVAYANKRILERFQADLVNAGYQTLAVDSLMPAMDEIMTKNSDFDSDGGRGIMSGVGARPSLRTLLDVGYQYPDVLFLSIHCNALEDNDPTGGLQVYYLDAATAYTKENEFAKENENLALAAPVYQYYRNDARARLANLILDGILDQIPELKYPGLSDVQTENFAVLRELNVTSVLIELGFLSSPEDRKILMNDNQRQKMAQAIADAVYQYYCQ